MVGTYLGSFYTNYTSLIVTPCFKAAILSFPLGINSWATYPLKPVFKIDFIIAG